MSLKSRADETVIVDTIIHDGFEIGRVLYDDTNPENWQCTYTLVSSYWI
jgi:hypothetical protein